MSMGTNDQRNGIPAEEAALSSTARLRGCPAAIRQLILSLRTPFICSFCPSCPSRFSPHARTLTHHSMITG